MSNALERARKLQQDVSRLKSRKTEQNQSEHLEQRRDELRTLRLNLDVAVIPILVLARRGRIAAAKMPKTAKLETDLAEMIRRAREEAPDAMTRGKDYSRFRDGTLKLAAATGDLVKEAWSAFCAELPAVNAVPLAEIALIPGQAEIVETVRQLDEGVKKLAHSPPRSEAEYDALVAQVDTLRGCLDELGEKSFPPAVRQFFKEAIRPSGADRALLTQEVLDWLQARMLLARVRLRFIEDVLPQKPAGPARGGKR